MYSLVSLDEVKTMIAVGEQEEADAELTDAKLEQVAEWATKLMQTYCRREFAEQSFTQFFDTRGNATYGLDIYGDASNVSGAVGSLNPAGFNLKGFPVDPDTLEVWYDPERTFAAASKLTQGTDYWYDEEAQRLYVLKAVGKSFRGLKAVYTAGYELGTSETANIITGAPDDLRIACLVQCVYLWNKIKESNIGIKTGADESPVYEINLDLLCTETKAGLKPYRNLLTGKR